MPRDAATPADLRDRETWSQAYDMRGVLSPGCVWSACRRYTIVRIPVVEPMTRERFLAFRRHGPPEQALWSPPSWSHGYDTPEQARLACYHHHLAEEGRPDAV